MRVLLNYSDNFDIQYGNYFVTNRKTKEIISEFERARYKILGLDPYDSKRNYVYLTTQVTRLLRLQEINYSYGNGAIVYKSNYFCNGMWHFNLHINSNLNCYMLVLVNDFNCRPPYVPDLTTKLLPPLTPVGVPLLNETPTLTAPNNILFVSPVEDMEYEYVKTKKERRSSKDFKELYDDDDSESESPKPKKKVSKKGSSGKAKKGSKKTSKKGSKKGSTKAKKSSKKNSKKGSTKAKKGSTKANKKK